MNNLAALINKNTGVTRMTSGAATRHSNNMKNVMRRVSRGGKGG